MVPFTFYIQGSRIRETDHARRQVREQVAQNSELPVTLYVPVMFLHISLGSATLDCSKGSAWSNAFLP